MTEVEFSNLLSELTKTAEALNRESDSINALIGRFEESLGKLNIGLEVWLDEPLQAWADGLKLRPMDGIVLDELVAGRTSLAEMKETLEACGLTLREARGAIDRLRAAQLVEPLETEGGV